jgi:hypothetical protein
LGIGSGATRATLRWRWAAEASATLVVARPGTPPLGPSDPAAITATVPRADYDRQDCWVLNLLPPRPATAAPGNGVAGKAAHEGTSAPLDAGPWHIRVYSVIDLEGSYSISPGLEPTAATVLPGPNPEVTVSYVIKRAWLPGLPWSVTFRTEPAGANVPPLVLVAHPRAVPVSVEDGQIVAHFPPGRDGARFPIRSRLNLSRHGARVFLDPNLGPDGLTPIRLRHPESGTTRV